MVELTYVIIPGLGDRRSLFIWFYKMVAKRWGRMEMRTLVYKPEWASGESYQDKLMRLNEVVLSERKEGRGVVLVGVSAGSALGLLAFNESDVQRFVSICGLLRLAEADYRKPAYVSKSWFRAADRAGEYEGKLAVNQKKRILTFSAAKDRVIDPHRERMVGVKDNILPARSHIIGIVMGLLRYRKEIERFATSIN